MINYSRRNFKFDFFSSSNLNGNNLSVCDLYILCMWVYYIVYFEALDKKPNKSHTIIDTHI